MKLGKTCAGAVAFFALASVAHAADLQPVLKAPAAVDQQATGYVEVYTGWARTTSISLGLIVSMAGRLAAPVAATTG